MITEKQKEIVKLLLGNKFGYNVNQIAKILNISVSWTHETLKNLEKDEILNSVKLGNAIFFKINWQNPKAEKICEFIILDEQSKGRKLNTNYNIIKNEAKENKIENNVGSNSPGYKKLGDSENKTNFSYSVTNNASGNVYGNNSINNNFSYSVVPMGNQGVNSLLSAYANSGAFGGSSAYSPVSYNNGPVVPAGTLGSLVSKNVAGFTLATHTSQHKENPNTGCRYCGPEQPSPF